MTHGIFSKTPLLPGENKDQFIALDEVLIKTYRPKDAIEVCFCSKNFNLSINKV
jgi:hypothetical protein